MRTGRRFLMVVGILAAAVSGYAQADYAFKVLASKGANEYKSGEGWQPVKTGISLKVGDELKVSEGAYIGLVSKNGKPLELKKPQSYKVADLLNQVGSGTSVMSKYTDFILSSNSAEAKKNRLSATGAVHRGEPTSLTVYLPPTQNSFVFNNSMYVVWEAPKSGGPYVVILTDFYDEVITKFETPETFYKLDLNDPKLANRKNFLVQVSSKADNKVHSDGIAVKRLEPAEQDKIKKAYAEIAEDVKDQTAFDKYILAGFYEQHGLIIDALSSYEEAVKMAPDVDTFTEARNEFLYRNKLAVQKQ